MSADTLQITSSSMSNYESRILNLEDELRTQTLKSSEWESKCTKSSQDNSRLKKENEDQKKKIQHLEERLKTMEVLMSAETIEKLEMDILKKKLEIEVNTLRKEKRDLEEELEEIKHERDELVGEQKEMILSREKYKQAQLKLEAGYAEQATLQMDGLELLRKSLIEHLNDMKVWKGYLDQERDYQSDTISSLTENTITGSSFEDQLEYLKSSLDAENTKLHQLVKDKEKEMEEAKLKKDGEEPISPRKKKK